MIQLQTTIEQAWENRALLQEENTQKAIREVIELIDSGILRVAQPIENGWQVNEWVKKAVVMYFPIRSILFIPITWDITFAWMGAESSHRFLNLMKVAFLLPCMKSMYSSYDFNKDS